MQRNRTSISNSDDTMISRKSLSLMKFCLESPSLTFLDLAGCPCLNDLVYSNTNSRQPCYISLLSLKSAGIFQQHWPWVLCVYFTWCRIYVNQDENFCYTHFVSSLNKYLWYLGPNHFALLKATLCQAWCKTKVLHLASGALHGKFSWRNYVLTSDLLINEVNGWTL